ncbi:hypothetical protein M378DRAFT_40911, partial [Amanita muscaria Koide BX008]
CVTGLTVRHVGERFQRANGTIAYYFKEMTQIFSAPPFYTSYVKQPNTANPPSHFFRNNYKLWPWFQHALGAIDGSHIHAHPRGANRHLYRNRK